MPDKIPKSASREITVHFCGEKCPPARCAIPRGTLYGVLWQPIFLPLVNADCALRPIISGPLPPDIFRSRARASASVSFLITFPRKYAFSDERLIGHSAQRCAPSEIPPSRGTLKKTRPTLRTRNNTQPRAVAARKFRLVTLVTLTTRTRKFRARRAEPRINVGAAGCK